MLTMYSFADDELQFFSPDGDLMLYNARENKTSVVISAKVFQEKMVWLSVCL